MWETLKCAAQPISNPFFKEEKERWGAIEMDGKEVFKFATGAIHECIQDVLEKEKLTTDDIAWIVPHQANIRIIEYAAKRNHIGMEKFYTNLERFGNTSSASIPIALAEMARKGLLKKGDKLILVGFGGGLTSGAFLLEWTR
jgi:3-oxoacyl-[acyl-carrier-protein] synthase-3